MSNREKIIAMLDSVPEYKLGYILAYMQGLTADEAADDAFCERMYQDYLDDPDRGNTVPFAQALEELGVSMDEIRD